MRSYLSLLAILCVSAGLSGCGHDHGDSPNDEGVIYEAGASDEAWLTFAEATATISDTDAPALTAPTGPIVRSGEPPTFTWSAGALALASPARGRALPRERGLLRLLIDALDPVPTARAHLPPVTGNLYRLHFALGGEREPVRVLTGRTSYTPSASVWAQMAAEGTTPTLDLQGAYFMEGRITEGPYARTAPMSLALQ